MLHLHAEIYRVERLRSMPGSRLYPVPERHGTMQQRILIHGCFSGHHCRYNVSQARGLLGRCPKEGLEMHHGRAWRASTVRVWSIRIDPQVTRLTHRICSSLRPHTNHSSRQRRSTGLISVTLQSSRDRGSYIIAHRGLK